MKAEPNQPDLEIAHEIVNAVRDEYGLASIQFVVGECRANKGYDINEAGDVITFRRWPMSYRAYFRAGSFGAEKVVGPKLDVSVESQRTVMIGKMNTLLRARRLSDE